MEQEGFVMQLAEAFLKSNGPAALSSCLSRFGEDEDGTRSVYNALSVIENLLEMKPDISQGILQQPKLRQFLVNGVKKDRPHSSIKQYCAELLAMLAQNDDGCKKLILSDGGIDTILECIGDMRKRDPESEDERETILDLFNILCSAMFIDEAKTLLLKAEGIQLMLILLKRRKWLRSQCLKLIDFSINGRKDGCKIFIDAGGLGVVFSFLMKVKGKERTTVEESLLSIIVELLRRTDGPDFERAVWKLEENSYEKLWRVTAILAQAAVDLQPYGDLEYSDRLDNGLYRAQLAAKCIALVCTKETNKPIASEMLKEVSLELNDVRTNLEELISNIDDDDEEAKSEKEFAAKLIEAVR
uniref:Beta-catenin-like protein 1 N-terminal domain-containing protein n=1 Tax=Rhodosorus marinus TaxID=101924 RepID=A0A7S2ZFN7_9RHOD|mmetsp:Transcript_16709/g.68422  ORF Transcript_16709/g.68422 Transcript_16709/m.68422 type:complete len:357 (+) Transcript_16709:591-1661(+)